ncbi:MAG: hypothetical protein JNL24_11045 [Bacteroidia bacterium]|nr:hypothetical protein [Bacteroidia bacterium]
MKNQIKHFVLAMIIAGSIFTGCKKDEDTVPTPPAPTNEGEVLTTFTLYFTDSANSANVVSATFRDPDGDGGNPFTQFDSIHLQANKTYYAQVVILNETASPADSISNEILEEANDHLFFYTVTGANAAVTITDLDTNTPTPLPLGLQTKWRTGAVSMGSTQIILKHQPGVKDGTFTPGSTDIDLTFQTEIQ